MGLFCFPSSSQTAASYIIRNPQPRRSSQSQPVRGRDEEQDDIVSADVEEVGHITRNDLRAVMHFELHWPVLCIYLFLLIITLNYKKTIVLIY